MQFLDPHETGAWGQVHQFGQFNIGDTAVALQFVQDADVDAVKFQQWRAPYQGMAVP